MLLLLLFAFLAGVFTILSPCILPILPAILSAGTLKGTWRPLGIIIGLIVSFTFFTLALTAIVHATGLSANVLRYVAIVIIGLFGLVMLFPFLSNWFAKITTPLANLGQNVQSTGESNGFIGGILFGVALGLLWTPCAGPILAAITTLVATQTVTFSTVLLTLAYSIGAGVPMFLIAYGGSKIIQSSKLLTKHAEGIRRFFGLLMIATAVAIALHWDMVLQQQVIRFIPPVLVEDTPVVKQQLELLGEGGNRRQSPMPQTSEGLGDYGPAPEIVGITNWINSPPLSIKQLHGKVALVDFWTYSCINCLRTLPYIEKWYQEYHDKGFVVIGVHTPEFEFEKDPMNVAEAAARLGVKYPIAQDNDYKTWLAYGNHYWPAHYLINQNGELRMVHFGEGKYVETENAIRTLLGMTSLKMEEPTVSVRPISPETYLGSERAQNYTKEIQLKDGQTFIYSYKRLTNDEAGLKGAWKVESQRIISEGDDSYLDYDFLATHVYLVMGGSSSQPVQVSLDGKPAGSFKMDGDRKYDIVTAPYGRHQLSIHVPKGVSVYAFTFGDESITNSP